MTSAALHLGALATNGGPTQTIALDPGSVAIDAGLDAVCAAAPVGGKDQRGVTRPYGAHCDTGSYEAVVVPTVTGVSPKTGPAAGWTNVTITGTAFTPGTVIRFGATQAAGLATSATSISATSPGGTGVVHVTVTTPGGTSATGTADTFTYVDPGTYYVALTPTATGGHTCAAPDFNTIAAAVAAANANPTFNTIHVCAGTYNLSARVNPNYDLAFIGDGAGSTILDGRGLNQIIYAIRRNVGLSRLTLRNGQAASGRGGAIQVVDGSVTVTDCVFTGNTAPGGGLGGAIHARGVSVTNSTFSGNSATGGGAIYADGLYASGSAAGMVTVTNSTFSGNSATGTDGGAILAAVGPNTITSSRFTGNTAARHGGAMSATGGSTTVTSSTFTQNVATTGFAGAVFAATVTVSGSTFDRNTASPSAGYGGAITTMPTTGLATVSNSTFSGNSARWGGAISSPNGSATNSTFVNNTAPTGGALYTPGGGATLANDILASGSSTNNCYGPIADSGGNFSTDASCGFSVATSHNGVALATLHLGSLWQSAFEPTATIALQEGSVAIDAGLDAVCAAAPVSGKDQRRMSRPQRIHCDSGAYEAPPSESTYISLSPTRILDTRSNVGLSGAFTSTVPRSLPVTGHGGVPSTAIAVTGNVTVTAQTAAGFVSLTTVSTPSPSTSTISFPLGDTRANGVTASLGTGGVLWITYVGATGGATTQILFDVTGYFVPDRTGATYISLSPSRILDTRSGTGLSGVFTSTVPRALAVTGHAGVPASAIAVTGNVTVTAQTSAGFVSLTTVSTPSPSTSTINVPLGDTRANGVTAPLGAGGLLWVTYVGAAGGATSHVLFDVTGYFVPDATGATYVSLSPARILDTRSNVGLSGAFTSTVPRSLQVIGAAAVPSNAVAVTGNVTVTSQTAAGYVSLTTVSTPSPTTSTINVPVGDTRANGVTAPLGTGGVLWITYVGATGGATTQILLDVTGYFDWQIGE